MKWDRWYCRLTGNGYRVYKPLDNFSEILDAFFALKQDALRRVCYLNLMRYPGASVRMFKLEFVEGYHYN